jgi:dephospho-CoA kinase
MHMPPGRFRAMDTISPHTVPRLGLTGGIGSGKSTALAYLRELGAAVISSDDIVHELLDSPEIATLIGEHFGEVALDEEGAVDRPSVARIVFQDSEELAWLESLLHPHVKRRVDEWARAAETVKPRPPLLVAEVPLLYETGMEGAFDYVLLVTAPPDIRRRRVVAKLTDSEFARRLEQQLPEEQKVVRADFVLHNTRSRRRLKQFVGETFASIISAAAAGERAERAVS